MIQARLTELNFNEILMYLGYRGQKLDAALETQIRRCMDDVMESSVPRLVYAVCPLEVRQGPSVPNAQGTEEYALSAGGLALEGNDIKELLKESGRAVFLAATAGARLAGKVAAMQVKDMGSAFIMDACASAAIENICNNFEADLRAEVGKDGFFLTDRFSPGYGDLPLSLQQGLCEKLNTSRRIGLTVTENCLMVPQKSVTAIMGIADKPQPKRKSGCESCSMFRTCAFRKQGRVCAG